MLCLEIIIVITAPVYITYILQVWHRDSKDMSHETVSQY